MFVLRRFPSKVPRIIPPSAQPFYRGNASVASAAPTSNPVPPLAPVASAVETTSKAAEDKPAKPTKLAETAKDNKVEPAPPRKTAGRRRLRKATIKRPEISLEKPRLWRRPIAEGIIPAYDVALKYLSEDSKQLKDEFDALTKEIDEKEAKFLSLKVSTEKDASLAQQVETLDEELEKLREKLHIVEVQSEINLPQVRWTVANAMVDTTNATHRHLMEQRWRKDGDLDLLMERVYQMNVVPDLLPAIRPSIDMRVVVPKTTDTLWTPRKTKKAAVSTVEPGSFVTPRQTFKPPMVYANVFHTDTRLYTMLLVDTDVPDEENASFTTYLHWMKPNIALSATSGSHILKLNTHTQYIPPHPQQGTPYHRYTLLLLPQPPKDASKYSCNLTARAGTEVTSQHLDIPVVTDTQRRGFNVRAFCAQWGLDASSGGAVHMWRELWSRDVSKIYSDILKLPEPRYALPPKADPYAEVKRAKRYVA